MTSFSLAATGDSFITRRLRSDEADFQQVASLLQQADIRFTNLETVIRRDEGFPSAQSGGTWASSEPEVLEDIKAYGFNLVAWANNHTLDYSYGGLESTERYLDQAGLVHAGAGSSLEEASAVRYLDSPGGKVALIAAVSTFHESWIAGAKRPDVGGRPGVNPLRYQTLYRVSAEKLAFLKEVAAETGVNALHDLRVKEGFATATAEGVLPFGDRLLFSEAAPGQAGESTSVNGRDLQRIVRAIDEAREKAALVIVSIHSHEGGNGRKDQPADFLVEFARACIDAGAHAVIGHGPHILRPVEIYRRRPIFYSLGNFIFQNELVRALPSDFYANYRLDPSLTVEEAFDFRAGGGKRGLAINPKVWHTVIARWTMTDGDLSELTFHPVSLGFGQSRQTRGVPRLTEELAALKEISDLSAGFGTKLCIENGVAVWNP